MEKTEKKKKDLKKELIMARLDGNFDVRVNNAKTFKEVVSVAKSSKPFGHDTDSNSKMNDPNEANTMLMDEWNIGNSATKLQNQENTWDIEPNKQQKFQ